MHTISLTSMKKGEGIRGCGTKTGFMIHSLSYLCVLLKDGKTQPPS